jgi:hypothetical protein
LEFAKFESDKLYAGKCSLNPNVELSDRWFFADPKTLQKFASLYDLIPEYMKPGRLDSSKQYGGISSHRMCRYHVNQMKMPVELVFNYGEVNRKPNDFSEVRRQYFKDRT